MNDYNKFVVVAYLYNPEREIWELVKRTVNASELASFVKECAKGEGKRMVSASQIW